MAGRVAGAVNDVEGQLANRHCVAMDEPTVGLKCLGMHAPFAAIIAQLRDPEAIIFMRAFNRHAELLR